MKPEWLFCRLRYALRGGLALVIMPSLLYLVLFALLSWPALLDFDKGIWSGAGDGLQGCHGMWWFVKAVLELGTNPWFTRYLNYPEGSYLFLYPVVPSNSMIGLLTVPALGVMQAYNAAIILTFVLSGVTAFWLVRAVAGTYMPALLGGFIYTFSNYHFAHAEGHMTLVSMQWMPLFFLCWWKLLSQPTRLLGILSAIALLLVAGCDSYYFLYCVTAGGLMAVYFCARQRDALLLFRRPYRLPILLFVVIALCTSGVLAFATLRFMNAQPPGSHFSPELFSLDVLALFIPGGHWRFRELTQWYWSQLPGNIHESSVHLGFGVLGLVFFGVFQKKSSRVRDMVLWVFLGLFFLLLALGPALFVAGHRVPYVGRGGYLPMLYTWVEHVFPPLLVGARPVRMVVIVILVSAVLGAAGAQRLWRGGISARITLAILLGLIAVEYLPKRLPLTIPDVPPFVKILAAMEGADGFYDGVTEREEIIMYHQTIHNKPIPFGRLARSNAKLADERRTKQSLFDAGDLDALHEHYRFRYFLVARDWPHLAEAKACVRIYEDEASVLLDMGRVGE